MERDAYFSCLPKLWNALTGQQLIKKVNYRNLEYHVLRDAEDRVFVKVDLGQFSALTKRPMLTQLGRGRINEEGTFSGMLTMKDREGNYLHPELRGSFVLKLLIATERENGKELQSFKSTWVAGAGISDNLEMLNAGLAQGLQEQEAALQTWTGQWLQKNHGFNKVLEIKGTFTIRQKANISYKHFTEVTALFSKAGGT